MEDTERILARTEALFATWCDRRCAVALRELLAGYPLGNPLTDGWRDLLSALEGVRAFARDELTEPNADEVEDLITAISQMLAGR